MGEALTHYFQVLTSPFAYQRHLRANTHKHSIFPESIGINYPEAFLISWPFIMMNVIYSFFSIELSKYFAYYLQGQYPLMALDVVKVDRFFATWQIYFTILAVIFFPIVSLAYVYFCRGIINFCLQLYGQNEDQEQAVDQVIISSFSSNAFLVIPVFGEVMRFFYALIILYGGLRFNLDLNRKQSFFILMFPFIMMMCFSFLVYAILMLFIWTILF